MGANLESGSVDLGIVGEKLVVCAWNVAVVASWVRIFRKKLNGGEELVRKV